MRPHSLWLAALLAAAPVAAARPQDARVSLPGASLAGAVVIASTEQAVAMALARSPALRGADASRAAVRGDALQAPLRPNPEASIVVENFGGIGGRGNYRGGRSVETTAGVSQRVELGGKRAARIALAARNGDVAGLDYEAARLDLVRDVVAALAEAEAASRNAAIEQERLRQAEETFRVAVGRADVGKDPPLQAFRTQVTRVTAAVALDRARRDAGIARRNLAVLLGVPQVNLAPRQAWFDDVGSSSPPPPVPADPFARLAANPDFAKLEAAIAQQRANLGLQRANAVPDVTLQGYVRRFQEGRETAFVAGASIPLPFNDRNQAGIARAQAELLRAEAEAERGRLAIVASLVAAERRTELAWRTVQQLRRVAVPAAEQAARLASAGFAEGKSTFLEVLDAQRAASDVRAQLNEGLRDFHARRAEAERLRGGLPVNLPAGDSR